MYEYCLLLPEFSERVLEDSLKYLKEEHSIICELKPGFHKEIKPEFETFMQFTFQAEKLKNWPYQDKTTVAGFELKVQKFDFKKSLELQKKSIGNLFGMVKKDKSTVDLEKVKKADFVHLKRCKREVILKENYNVFGSYVITPIFAVALTLASKGLIYEGELCVERSQIIEDYWPTDDEVEELKEDIDDGERPEFFTGWY